MEQEERQSNLLTRGKSYYRDYRKKKEVILKLSASIFVSDKAYELMSW